jgi:hypothetical protein
MPKKPKISCDSLIQLTYARPTEWMIKYDGNDHCVILVCSCCCKNSRHTSMYVHQAGKVNRIRFLKEGIILFSVTSRIPRGSNFVISWFYI